MTRYYVEKESTQVAPVKAGVEVSFNLSGTPDDWFSVSMVPHDAIDLAKRIYKEAEKKLNDGAPVVEFKRIEDDGTAS